MNELNCSLNESLNREIPHAYSNRYDGRMKVAILSLSILLWSCVMAGQSRPDAVPSVRIYSNRVLGFRYAPPTGMQDATASERATMQARASALNATKMFDLLLAMESSPAAGASSWNLLTIETYPRQALGGLDDITAEAKVSSWVAGVNSSLGTPRSVVLSGQNFAVFVVGEREGTIKKGAVIWTTIRKGKLLSFAFVANSPQQLTKLAESMKSVQFF